MTGVQTCALPILLAKTHQPMKLALTGVALSACWASLTDYLMLSRPQDVNNALLEFPGCAMVISHDRWFLDRIATHILDYQDEGKVEFFEGNFTEYEEYKKRTLGADALEPKRIKYKRIAK